LHKQGKKHKFAQKNMRKSTVAIDVHLDDTKVPEAITWQATDSNADMKQSARAMMLSFWDAEDKSALRIDLWTKQMMVDEMVDFQYQTLMGMADTLQRATQQAPLANEMRAFAKNLVEKFRASQIKENQ
jgi:gliding motility-associated protein GldC